MTYDYCDVGIINPVLHLDTIDSLAKFSENNILFTSDTQKILVCDFQSGDLSYLKPTLKKDEYIKAFDINRDGSLVVLVTHISQENKDTIVLLNVKSGKITSIASQTFLYNVKIKNNIVAYSTSYDIVLYNIDLQTYVQLFNPESSRIHTFSFSKDGNLLAYEDNQNIQIYNLSTGNTLTLAQKSGPLGINFEFSPDNSLLINWTTNNSFSVWDIEKNKFISIDKHKDFINSASFSPSENLFATASDDGQIFTWDSTTLVNSNMLVGDGEVVVDIDFHPTQSLLIAGYQNGDVLIWNYKSGKQLASHNIGRGLIDVVFSPTGDLYVAAGFHETYVWKVSH
jgi:WD40 repeat protein